MLDQAVVVVQGDITAARTDVIVNAANEHLVHGGGVAAALAAAAGKEFVHESRRWVSENGPVQPGQAAVTTGGRLAARWVVHVVGPRYRKGQDNETLLRQAVRAALDAAKELGAKTVAMPALSTGVFGFPPARAAGVAVRTVSGLVADLAGIAQVTLCCFSEASAEAHRAALEAVG